MKTEIEFESHELTVIRVYRSRTASVFCPLCECKTTHLSVAHTATLLQISETAVFRLVESGTVHSMETAAGALLVCGNSISVLKNEEKIIKGEKRWDL